MPWTNWHTTGLVVIVIACVVIGSVIPIGGRIVLWWLILLLLALFALIAGHGITGLWRGVLIDERYMISLSKLQTFVWTIVVLAALFTVAFWRLNAGLSDPLAIAVQQELWWVIGISTASLIGSPLIKSNKMTGQANPTEKDTTLGMVANRRGVAQKTIEQHVSVKGYLIVNNDPKQARWSDLFRGEETGNGAILDLGKVQVFFFTIILVLTYCATVVAMLGNNDVASALPQLDGSMVVLLGISHAGYLTFKAIPHSQPI